MEYLRIEIARTGFGNGVMAQVEHNTNGHFITEGLAKLLVRDKATKELFAKAIELADEYESRVLATIDAQAEKFTNDIDQLIKEINQQ
ncbi:MAG: hypothetical protein AB7U05_09155 [Mangrovibacterium sp.]